MDIEILNNVPKPPQTSKVGRPQSYPFAKMTLGQSFVKQFTSEDAKDRKNLKRNLSIAVSNFNKKNGNLQTILTVVDVADPKLGGPGVGVWCETKPEATV